MLPLDSSPIIHPIDLDAHPAQVLRAWPTDRPLAALWSADAPAARWSRWSIFAPCSPSPDLILEHADETGFDRLEAAAASTRHSPSGVPPGSDLPPFRGGWIGAITYPDSAPRPGWPGAVFFRCPAAYVHDNLLRRWWRVGDPRSLPDPRILTAGIPPTPFSLDLEDSPGARERYTAAVARAIEYIRAGDIFQANITRTLRARFDGCARALWLAMLDAAAPWYGAFLEWDGRAILSASPELFFGFDVATRAVTTRPIKGTRPGRADPRDLLDSPKDRAELNMIIDLMRNDLGRIAEYGSVRVAEPVTIERHAAGAGAAGTGGVLHSVATIEARLRRGLTASDVLRAAFPAGSITGAPKVRAMQIIDELEPSSRGPYTGAIGFLSDCGNASFNVAIRTAAIHGGELAYGVGAGIVADSDPTLEWDETETKASILRAAAARSARAEAVLP